MLLLPALLSEEIEAYLHIELSEILLSLYASEGTLESVALLHFQSKNGVFLYLLSPSFY